MGLIIFLFLNALYLSKNYSKKFNYLFTFSNIFLISTILLLQSRGAILCFILIFILINFLYKFDNLKSRLKYLLLFLLIPILIFILYPNGKNYLIGKFNVDKDKQTIPKKEFKIKNLDINLRDDIIPQSKIDKSFKKKFIHFQIIDLMLGNIYYKCFSKIKLMKI